MVMQYTDVLKQVCVEPPTVAVKVALPAFAAECQCIRSTPADINWYLLPTGHSAANLQLLIDISCPQGKKVAHTRA